MQVNRLSHTINWGRGQIDSDFVGVSWNVTLAERTDDYAPNRALDTTGFEVKAKYQGYQVTNKVVPIKTNVATAVHFLAEDELSDYTVSVTCWSTSCNPFVMVN